MKFAPTRDIRVTALSYAVDFGKACVASGSGVSASQVLLAARDFEAFLNGEKLNSDD